MSKKCKPGFTPSFPEMAKESPEVSAKGEAPPATEFPGKFLSGFSCPVQDPKDRAAWKRYEDYINSARWREKCRLVLDRAGGACEGEGCGIRGVLLEVHHDTYAHLGDEPLCDLRALCKPCHNKADEERRTQRDAAIRRWRMEAEEAYMEARFRGWVIAQHGADFYDCADHDTLADERERFDEWARDRDGEDLE
jgi:hypothetical protein